MSNMQDIDWDQRMKDNDLKTVDQIKAYRQTVKWVPYEDYMKEIYHLSMLLDNINIDIYATKETHEFLTNYNIKSNLVSEPLEYIRNNLVDLIVNIPSKKRNKNDINYNIRRNAIDSSIPLITNIKIAIIFITSINRYKFKELEIKSWQEYICPDI